MIFVFQWRYVQSGKFLVGFEIQYKLFFNQSKKPVDSTRFLVFYGRAVFIQSEVLLTVNIKLKQLKETPPLSARTPRGS